MTIIKQTFLLGLVVFVSTAFMPQQPPKKFHDLKIAAINGKDTIRFSDFKGKKVLCVNTASQCGYTPQYEGLQKLAEQYADQLIVIGFPCNQFGEQEPGNPDQIAYFCKARYQISFPLTEKIDVKGDQQHPVYQWLTQKKFNGKEDVNVRWNFGKFLIDEEGKLMAYFPSQVTPLDAQITALIKGK